MLHCNPDSLWTQRDAIPREHGFVSLWRATIPTGDVVHEIDGVCLVVVRDGRISRNEVNFDRSALLGAARGS